jgi:hypothetical protein
MHDLLNARRSVFYHTVLVNVEYDLQHKSDCVPLQQYRFGLYNREAMNFLRGWNQIPA